MSNEISVTPQIDTKLINPLKSRLDLNFRRVKRLACQRARNLRHVSELLEFRKEFHIDCEQTNDSLDKYSKRIGTCCSRAVGHVNVNDKHNHVALKTAMFCDHRLCSVCNALRAQKLRRKFWNFLTSDERNIFLKEKYRHFFPNLDSDTSYISGKQISENFDFMHLTLTVPHNNGLWKGKQYYARELLKLFTTMRKCEWWTDLVFAGEGCVETVQTENNLHIHIHALLLVKKNQMQSRNNLYIEILKKWNELTIDETVQSEKFEPKRKIGIQNTISFLRNKDTIDSVIESLDPRGSTMVGLSSLYKEVTYETYLKARRGKFMRDGKFFCYVNSSNPKELLKGVLECLKYHFEPCSIEDEDGKINGNLLCSLLPNIYKQRLYSKFGGFYGVQQLNIAEEPIQQVDIEDFIQTAQSECYDPVSGEPCHSNDLQFIIFDIKDLVFKGDDKHYTIPARKIKDRMERGPTTVLQATLYLIESVVCKRLQNARESFYKSSNFN